MTQRPPDPLPDADLVLTDGMVIPGIEAAEAWGRACSDHKHRVDAENRRYQAECAQLRERYGPPAGAVMGRGMSWPAAAWTQEELDPSWPR